jgi:DNA-3-methyladenine glycosylase II
VTAARHAAGERVIVGPDCVAEGAAWLARTEPRFAEALARTGPLPLRRRDDGFAALLAAIVSQQVSVAAADDASLRTCGLSRQKARYARALAQADLPYAELRDAPSEAVIATLVAVPGIGRWTAEIYAMFSLGRADVFAPADLALQEAARLLFELESRPRERDLRAMAAAWSPWRAVAARLLWAHYRVARGREGVS